MAPTAKCKIFLKTGSWDCVNPILNGPVAAQMLEKATKDIFDAAYLNISSDTSIADGLQHRVAPPGGGSGVRMGFVSLPSLAYEMKYNVLKEALDDAREAD